LDIDLGNIKINILDFQCKNDLEAYLEREKMKLIFYCHNYFKVKINLIVIEFIDYAIIWWDQLVLEKRRKEERPI
jgi:hypothetical protein